VSEPVRASPRRLGVISYMSLHQSKIYPGVYREPATGREIYVSSIRADTVNPEIMIVNFSSIVNSHILSKNESMPLSEFSVVGRFVRISGV
jgi:hypothetical protein